MAVSGRIRRRLALAIVLTALIPLVVAVLLAHSMVKTTSARFFEPEVGTRLDQSLSLYQELARAVKASMRNEASAIAQHEPLRRAAASSDAEAIRRQLGKLFPQYPNLVSLAVVDADGDRLASVDRGSPVDPETENDLEVIRPLSNVGQPDEKGSDGEARAKSESAARKSCSCLTDTASGFTRWQP